ncbi:hypothetical protein ABUE38_06545 [Pediococcus parvulus]|uniref:Uncharacterized protein n=1 Tax=Pediococcus parvulus TaxID=54062 RepID=A0AAP5TB08_9LACO|nr:hypothetical protein [Pediococcus parvulus]MDV7693298.1 hypothetical protein [Pediococcus parvulus]OAD63644.1 hypothetical protein A7K95_00775 [Pediococcus parvulus]
MLINEIDDYIEKMSKNLSFKTSNAFEVSKKFKLKRNTASHYLNLLVHSKRLLKISTRPVIFIGREWFLNNGGNGELDGFQSLRDLHDFMKKNQKRTPLVKSLVMMLLYIKSWNNYGLLLCTLVKGCQQY